MYHEHLSQEQFFIVEALGGHAKWNNKVVWVSKEEDKVGKSLEAGRKRTWAVELISS